MSSLVSIIIPTYNRETLIRETVESALAQDYEDIEIIVSDNASTDQTALIVEKFAEADPRVKLFQNSRNLGPVLNWKTAIDKANGEYIKILWSDDLMTPDFIRKSVSLFEQDDDLAFVFSKVVVGCELNKPRGVLYEHFTKTGIFESIEFVRGIVRGESLPYSPGCAIFKTTVLKDALILDNDLFQNRYLENGAGPDLLMFLMAAKRAPRFGFIDEELSFFREHEGSITMSTNKLGMLGVDYAKAIIWYLCHYVGQDAALRYWIHTFKKKKLFRYRARQTLRGFLFRHVKVRYMSFRHLYYLLLCYLLRSKVYLKRIELGGDFSHERIKEM